MPLQLHLLPTSAGDGTQTQPLTSFIVNGTIAIDAGSLGFSLTGEQLAGIEHVLLTHSHLDHTASLPMAIDAAYPFLKRAMRIYGQPPTLAAVRKHLFNDEVWVDFSKFKILQSDHACMEWIDLIPRQPLVLDGLKITPIPVRHPVPTVGLILQSLESSVVITSDTWETEEIWQAAAKVPNLRAVFIECSFPDEMEKLAQASGHLTPRLVAEQTAKLGKRVPVYCVHLKPNLRSKVVDQLAVYKSRGIEIAEVGKRYSWP